MHADCILIKSELREFRSTLMLFNLIGSVEKRAAVRCSPRETNSTLDTAINRVKLNRIGPTRKLGQESNAEGNNLLAKLTDFVYIRVRYRLKCEKDLVAVEGCETQSNMLRNRFYNTMSYVV